MTYFYPTTLILIFAFLSGCEVETRQCQNQSDCFANEICTANRCEDEDEIEENNGVDISNNGDANNGEVSCVENGTINVGEECESGVALPTTCEKLGYDSGTLKCKNCQYDTSACVSENSTCGDGVAIGIESCDGADLKDFTCENIVGLGSTGSLSCTSACALDTSDCSVVYIDLSTSSNHSCATRSDGRISCWGPSTSSDAQASLLGKYTEVSTASGFSCGLERSGGIQCWGSEFGSNLDVPDERFSHSVSSGDIGSCAIKVDGTASCWGFRGELLNPPSVEFSQLSVGGTHACGVSEGEVLCWEIEWKFQRLRPTTDRSLSKSLPVIIFRVL